MKTALIYPDSSRGQRNKRRIAKNAYASKAAIFGNSPANRGKFFKPSLKYTDARFDVPTANRFEVLDNLAVRSSRSHQEGKTESVSFNREAPPHSKNWSGTRTLLPIFTIEQLDNQIRVFNLTKYVQTKPIRSLPSTESVATLCPQPDNTTVFKPVSQPVYIPPHKRCYKSPQFGNPNFSPGSLLPDLSDKPVHIDIDDVENSWIECFKKGLFAIWTGPAKDLHL